MTVGNKTVVDAVFADTGSDVFLEGPKRPQGNSVAAETAASVADSVEMTGISVNGITGSSRRTLSVQSTDSVRTHRDPYTVPWSGRERTPMRL